MSRYLNYEVGLEKGNINLPIMKKKTSQVQDETALIHIEEK